MAQNLDIKWLNITDSTNNRAQEGISSEKDRTIWAAEFQTSGRGQRGNTWKADKAMNLTFSILLKPGFVLAKDQFIISVIVTLGIESYLRKKGICAKIKWPNDIYVQNRKICGILIEHSIAGEELYASVCGIGLNINQRHFPEDLPNPTSLILEKSGSNTEEIPDYDLKAELKVLATEIFHFYHMAEEEFSATGKYDKLYDSYIGKLYRKDEWHHFTETEGNKITEARIIGINDTACIVLEYRDGSRKSFAFKEISYII